MLWACGVIAWWECVVEQSFSPHGWEVKEEEEGAVVSLSPLRAYPQSPKD